MSASADAVEVMIEAFIRGAERAEEAGFHGVELHGAHGYLLCQFLSAETNRRDDRFGGSLENRMAPLQRIIDGIRARCGAAFQLGVRLSPERFGMTLHDATEIARRLLAEEKIDYLDLSLWDIRKDALDAPETPLIAPFMALPRGKVAVGVAGKINSGEDVRFALEQGADFVLLGRAAILHHDFPKRLAADGNFQAATLPVTRAHLVAEGLSPHVSWSVNSVHMASLALTFLLVVVAVHLLAKLLEKVLDLVALGFANKLAGGVFGALKVALVLSFVMLLLNQVVGPRAWLPESEPSSMLVGPVEAIAPAITPALQRLESLDALDDRVQEKVSDLERQALENALPLGTEDAP